MQLILSPIMKEKAKAFGCIIRFTFLFLLCHVISLLNSTNALCSLGRLNHREINTKFVSTHLPCSPEFDLLVSCLSSNYTFLMMRNHNAQAIVKKGEKKNGEMTNKDNIDKERGRLVLGF